MDDHLISTAEAARRLNVTPDALRMWRYRKLHLPYVKIGSRCMYRVSVIEDFIKSATVELADAEVGA